MLDLEYNKHANPILNSSTTEDLLTELFHELVFQFKLVYGICIKRSAMIDLESSTQKSSHVIGYCTCP